ncbi:protein FAR1-RELATED SEQUENCE 5-like [Lolium perenne]|uniref:protein FAR1-RELATED SEQUENCE 5-like n=1 Tax=Lolium perenne TaxID=4522 RepID=UPI0021F50C7B|nr:protein FAR1-RELATED SEQUENCE 5-like [Lolium perenne]
MAKAIPAVFLDAIHRNCLFHVVKKAEEKHPRSFGKIPNLHNEFKDTIHFSLTVAEFESSWQEMIEKYEVSNLKYLKTMWENRAKFVPVFFKNNFFPFIHSTARSEGTNAIFKDNVCSTYSVSSFLSEYDKIAENIEENEKHEDSITRTTTPSYWCGNDMEVHARKKYNRKIFYRFQKQLKFTAYRHVQEVEPNKKYEVYKSGLAATRDYRRRRYLVIVDLTSDDFKCICSKFNKDGILCSHVLKVLVHLNIVHIPDKYFIARWMPREKKDIRDLRYNHLMDQKSNEKYLFVTQEVKKIAEKLDAMTLAEDKAKEVDPKEKSKEQVVKTECGYLNDPKVVKSKERPTILGKNKLDRRYMTFAEHFLGKQQITCSHWKKKTTDETSKKTKKAKEK